MVMDFDQGPQSHRRVVRKMDKGCASESDEEVEEIDITGVEAPITVIPSHPKSGGERTGSSDDQDLDESLTGIDELVEVNDVPAAS